MNDRQRRFCEEYLVDMNAKRAALRAGYSLSTAKYAAWRWVNPENPACPEVRAEIDRLLERRSRRTRMSADRVVRELARIAFAGEADAGEAKPEEAGAPDGGGEAKPEESRASDRAEGAARKRVARRASAESEVRTQDRLRALELLGKHLGMFAGGVQPEQLQPVIVDEAVAEEAAESQEAAAGKDVAASQDAATGEDLATGEDEGSDGKGA